MTKQTMLPAFYLLITLLSCQTSSTQSMADYIPSDTNSSLKIYNYWVTPRAMFDLNSFGKYSGDTLHLVTCSKYVYFPFGTLKNKSTLNSSLLKNFNIISCKLDTFTNIMLPSDPSDDFKQWSESVELELGKNKLSLFFDNDPDASMHGYIRGGQIFDSNVVFSENIKVGMGIEDFFGIFFKYFPKELTIKYRVIEFESCVTDVTHVYTFNNGQLRSVKFISH